MVRVSRKRDGQMKNGRVEGDRPIVYPKNERRPPRVSKSIVRAQK
jgi:hypothetical protein